MKKRNFITILSFLLGLFLAAVFIPEKISAQITLIPSFQCLGACPTQPIVGNISIFPSPQISSTTPAGNITVNPSGAIQPTAGNPSPTTQPCQPVTVHASGETNTFHHKRGHNNKNTKKDTSQNDTTGLLEKLIKLIEQIMKLIEQLLGTGTVNLSNQSTGAKITNTPNNNQQIPNGTPNPTSAQNTVVGQNPTVTLPPCPTNTPAPASQSNDQPTPIQPAGGQPNMTQTTPGAGIQGGGSISGVGMGTAHNAKYLTNVTGGGAFPDISNGIIANCAGDGSTDDTKCLQDAMNQACSAKVPLLIPFKSSPYKISNSIKVCGSVIGTGGMPTIAQSSTSADESGVGLSLESGMSGWIYNLRITGTYISGQKPDGEWAQNISVGPVNGVTIKGNILEKPRGANIGDSAKGPPATNVLVDNNTMLDPWECNIALVDQSDKWVITNNFLDYKSGYVTPVDYEPWQSSSYISNIEFAYNKVMCAAVGFGSCMQITAWFDQTPGENIYTHHNYGSWVDDFPTDDGYKGSGVHFNNVVTENNNVEGDSVPSP